MLHFSLLFLGFALKRPLVSTLPGLGRRGTPEGRAFVSVLLPCTWASIPTARGGHPGAVRYLLTFKRHFALWTSISVWEACAPSSLGFSQGWWSPYTALYLEPSMVILLLLTFCFAFKLFSYFVFMTFCLFVCPCSGCMKWPKEAREGGWHRSYRQLWTTLWVLGIQPGPLEVLFTTGHHSSCPKHSYFTSDQWNTQHCSHHGGVSLYLTRQFQLG